MEFEWDESKRISNLRKHGVDFTDVPAVFAGAIVTIEDDRFDDGEERFVTFGLLQGYVVAVVHTESEDYIRMSILDGAITFHCTGTEVYVINYDANIIAVR